MKRKGLAVLASGLVTLLLACHDSGPVAAARDGSTPERAVVFSDIETSFEAVPLEEVWVETHHPGAEVVEQALIMRDGRTFDRLTLQMPDGETRTVFFDLTAGMQGGGEAP